MALINPSSLYSGGQGVLKDNVVDYITHLEQKKTARKDALDKYYMDLPNKINTAGMRHQDIDGANGGFNKKMDELRNFGMVNKEEIRKGGRKAQEYQRMWDGVRQYVDESKRVGQFQLQTGQDYFKGKHRVRNNDMEIMNRLDQPIDSDNHYKDPTLRLPYTYNDFSAAAPDFDGNRKQQYFKSALGAIKPVYDEKNARIDNNTGEVFIPKKFDQQAITTVADNFANGLKGNVSASNYYEDLLEDKDFVKQASEVISQFTGQKREITTPEDLAAADAIMQLTNSAGEEKITDVNYAQKLKKDMADYKQKIWEKQQPIKLANQKDYLATKEKYKNESEEKVTKDVSAFIKGQIEDAVNNPVPMTANDFEKEKKNIPGVTQILTPYKIRTSPVILEVFSQKDPAGNIYKPHDIYYNPDKKTIVLKGGEKNGSDREITTDEYQAALVNKVFNTKTKLNQINTDETVVDDKKNSQSGSSSIIKKTSKWDKYKKD